MRNKAGNKVAYIALVAAILLVGGIVSVVIYKVHKSMTKDTAPESESFISSIADSAADTSGAVASEGASSEENTSESVRRVPRNLPRTPLPRSPDLRMRHRPRLLILWAAINLHPAHFKETVRKASRGPANTTMARRSRSLFFSMNYSVPEHCRKLQEVTGAEIPASKTARMPDWI